MTDLIERLNKSAGVGWKAEGELMREASTALAAREAESKAKHDELYDRMAVWRDRAIEAERQRDTAMGLLAEARDNLIYWEPQTRRGAVAKADLRARIETCIAKAKESTP